jgi:hypothetical protein
MCAHEYRWTQFLCGLFVVGCLMLRRPGDDDNTVDVKVHSGDTGGGVGYGVPDEADSDEWLRVTVETQKPKKSWY